MNYNELPVHPAWALRINHDRLRDENQDTYEALRMVCTRGEAPCGGKVVVRELSPSGTTRRFAVVCNPIRLDTAHIALFCDRGGLAFGYHVDSRGIIFVYTKSW